MTYGTEKHFNGAVKPSSIEQELYDDMIKACRYTEIPTNLIMRIEYSDNNAIYVGFAAHGMAEGTNGWLIHKFTYDGNNNVTARNISYGNWTDRASLTYN